MGICDWANVNEKMKLYHDCEWGVPVYDDTVQFEYLVLELMQSGLSWNTILQKRETLKSAYANFNYEVLADYVRGLFVKGARLKRFFKTPEP